MEKKLLIIFAVGTLSIFIFSIKATEVPPPFNEGDHQEYGICLKNTNNFSPVTLARLFYFSFHLLSCEGEQILSLSKYIHLLKEDCKLFREQENEKWYLPPLYTYKHTSTAKANRWFLESSLFSFIIQEMEKREGSQLECENNFSSGYFLMKEFSEEIEFLSHCFSRVQSGYLWIILAQLIDGTHTIAYSIENEAPSAPSYFSKRQQLLLEKIPWLLPHFFNFHLWAITLHKTHKQPINIRIYPLVLTILIALFNSPPQKFSIHEIIYAIIFLHLLLKGEDQNVNMECRLYELKKGDKEIKESSLQVIQHLLRHVEEESIPEWFFQTSLYALHQSIFKKALNSFYYFEHEDFSFLHFIRVSGYGKSCSFIKMDNKKNISSAQCESCICLSHTHLLFS